MARVPVSRVKGEEDHALPGISTPPTGAVTTKPPPLSPTSASQRPATIPRLSHMDTLSLFHYDGVFDCAIA